MTNYKFISSDKLDEIDKRIIDRSFNVLISVKYSAYRKMGAAESLAPYVRDHKFYRERFEILYKHEKNPTLKELMRKILTGEYKIPSYKNGFEMFEQEHQEADEYLRKQVFNHNVKHAKEVTNNLKYMSYLSRINNEIN